MSGHATQASDLLDANELRDLAVLAAQVQRRAGDDPGMITSERVGRGFELQGLDPFRTGDDVRAIDWRTRLRTGELWVRRHHTEGDLAIRVVLDNSPSMTQDKRRNAARIAAAICVVAGTAALPIAIDALGATRGMPGRARLDGAELRRALAAITRLASTASAEPLALPMALERARRGARPDEHVIVISDLADPSPPDELATAIARLARDVVCVHVIDERDRIIADDVDEIISAETGARRHVGDRSTFATRVAAWQIALAEAFRRRRVPMVVADAAHPARLIEVASQVVASWS